jgi:hypothetical protein
MGVSTKLEDESFDVGVHAGRIGRGGNAETTLKNGKKDIHPEKAMLYCDKITIPGTRRGGGGESCFCRPAERQKQIRSAAFQPLL